VSFPVRWDDSVAAEIEHETVFHKTESPVGGWDLRSQASTRVHVYVPNASQQYIRDCTLIDM
jgi:hypothetical protein